MTWVVRGIAVAALAVVGWVCLTAWPAVVHGHPLYAVLLALTTLVALVVGGRTLRRRDPAAATGRSTGTSTSPATSSGRPAPSGLRRTGRVVLAVAAVAWVAVIAWLRPFPAVEPAPAALVPDAAVAVSQGPTQIVLTPTGEVSPVGVLFQPGARVEARAYAAVLRPLAEAGHLVVIVQQPLGIGFLATGAFESARSAHPEVSAWVVGGHSLGGTVAALDAQAHDDDASAPVTGLMLWASYPASDLSDALSSRVLSLSGTQDGLATPETIEASRADLPADATFTAVDGASHASFGDYGPQPGDGTPTISDDDARAQISGASLAFLADL